MIVINSIVDIHCHTLCGVDDGAANEREMHEMLRMAYEDGIRKICFTPHFDPKTESGESNNATPASFSLAEEYCRAHLPDMQLLLGNELSYRVGCIESLVRGDCRTLAGGRYVLVDFLMVRDLSEIQRGISAIANSGYIPIVAHVERYECLKGKHREIARFGEEGALIQINVESLRYGPLSSTGRLVRRLLSDRIVDLVASDAHNLTTRPPRLAEAYKHICAKYGRDYGDYLFSVNPERVLSNMRIK